MAGVHMNLRFHLLDLAKACIVVSYKCSGLMQ